MSEKKPPTVLDYFMERTKQDFQDVNKRLDKHDTRQWVMIALIVLLSPVGLEIAKHFPNLLDVAAAFAGVK